MLKQPFMKYLLSFTFCFLITATTFATHIRGKLTDQKGEVLSFASIYVRGTSTGTTSNIDGLYDFVLEEGSYELVFQYVGYESKTETITHKPPRKPQHLMSDPQSETATNGS